MEPAHAEVTIRPNLLQRLPSCLAAICLKSCRRGEAIVLQVTENQFEGFSVPMILNAGKNWKEALCGHHPLFMTEHSRVMKNNVSQQKKNQIHRKNENFGDFSFFKNQICHQW